MHAGDRVGQDGGERTAADHLEQCADRIGFDRDAWRDAALGEVGVDVQTCREVAAEQPQRIAGWSY